MKLRWKALIIAFVVVVVLASILALIAMVPKSPKKIKNLENISVLAIGESTPLFEEIVEGLQNCSVVVTVSNDVPNSTEEIGNVTAILFDGEWIEAHVDYQKLHNFLKDAVPKRYKVTCVGGETSKFFEVLNRAGIFSFPEDRNPAASNPPVVGYKVKQEDGNDIPVVFRGFGDDIEGLIEDFLEFCG